MKRGVTRRPGIERTPFQRAPDGKTLLAIARWLKDSHGEAVVAEDLVGVARRYFPGITLSDAEFDQLFPVAGSGGTPSEG